jgi:outer membrane protein OmpA-like peptidoglycan-associated protein
MKTKNIIYSLISFFIIVSSFWACRPTPITTTEPNNSSRPNRVSMLSEEELAKIAKEKESLQKQIDNLLSDTQKLKSRNSGESLDRLLVPIELIEKSILKEADLLKAFGNEPDSDDLAAMKERLDAKDKRLEGVLEQYAILDKVINQLNTKIIKLQKDIEDIRMKHPGSALEDLIVPIEKLDQSIAEEKSLLLAFEKDPTEDDLNALLDRLNQIDTQLDKARKSYRYTKDLDIQFKAGTLFESGQTVLSERGKKQMSIVAKDIQKSIDRYRKKFPNDTLSLVLKVKGYADEQPFYSGQSVAERKQQNIEISQKRAEALGNFIVTQIPEPPFVIKKEFEGLGEALPQGVEAGLADDANRRICTLSISMLSDVVQ